MLYFWLPARKARPDKPQMIVTIGADLEPILPGYLSRVQDEVEQLLSAHEKSDFSIIGRIAHNWKGSGSGYGLDRISELGTALEEAAQRKDLELISTSLKEMQSFLASLEIRYA